MLDFELRIKRPVKISFNFYIFHSFRFQHYLATPMLVVLPCHWAFQNIGHSFIHLPHKFCGSLLAEHIKRERENVQCRYLNMYGVMLMRENYFATKEKSGKFCKIIFVMEITFFSPFVFILLAYRYSYYVMN